MPVCSSARPLTCEHSPPRPRLLGMAASKQAGASCGPSRGCVGLVPEGGCPWSCHEGTNWLWHRISPLPMALPVAVGAHASRSRWAASRPCQAWHGGPWRASVGALLFLPPQLRSLFWMDIQGPWRRVCICTSACQRHSICCRFAVPFVCYGIVPPALPTLLLVHHVTTTSTGACMPPTGQAVCWQ